MRIHLRTLVAVGAVLGAVFACGPASAQDGGGDRPGERLQQPGAERPQRPSLEQLQKQRGEARVRLIEALKLSPSQKEKVVALLVERDQKRDELMEKARSGGRDREAFRQLREEMDKSNAQIRKQLEALLSPEQMAIYQKHLEDARGPWGRGGGRDRGPRGGANRGQI